MSTPRPPLPLPFLSPAAPVQLKLMNEDWRGRDIKQGALGDCWFVSAIAVLGKRSDLVYSVFVEPHINPYGVYGVRFWKDGEVRIVVVDDLFPANVGGKVR